jgi:hypothetical protein
MTSEGSDMIYSLYGSESEHIVMLQSAKPDVAMFWLFLIVDNKCKDK